MRNAVVIVGSGMMGAGIAARSVAAGCPAPSCWIRMRSGWHWAQPKRWSMLRSCTRIS